MRYVSWHKPIRPSRRAIICAAVCSAEKATYFAPGTGWIWRCKKPIITAVHGRCYTAGLELVLAGDMCVAATGTQFAQLETKRGIFPFGGGTLRLPEAIGWGNAMRCILAGGTFSAEDALRWGLVLELADTADLPKQALLLAREVVSCAPLAVRAALANARLAKTVGTAQAIEDIRTEGRRIALTQDAREGTMSLMQRRTAKFVGASTGHSVVVCQFDGMRGRCGP